MGICWRKERRVIKKIIDIFNNISPCSSTNKLIERNIFKSIYLSLLVIFFTLNILTYFFVSKHPLKGLALFISLVALISHFLILLNNKWTIVFDLLFLLAYGYLSYQNRIYSEAFIKIFILLPLNIWGLRLVFSKKSKREWIKLIYLERKNTTISQNKFYFTSMAIVVLGFLMRNILSNLGDKYANYSVICIISSFIATILHYNYDSSKWFYWIIYNATTFWIWFNFNVNPNITLYNLYFLLISIIASCEYLINRKKYSSYNSIFSIDILEMEKIRRKNSNKNEKY